MAQVLFPLHHHLILNLKVLMLTKNHVSALAQALSLLESISTRLRIRGSRCKGKPLWRIPSGGLTGTRWDFLCGAGRLIAHDTPPIYRFGQKHSLAGFSPSLSIYMYISIYLSVCLSIYLSIYLSLIH